MRRFVVAPGPGYISGENRKAAKKDSLAGGQKVYIEERRIRANQAGENSSRATRLRGNKSHHQLLAPGYWRSADWTRTQEKKYNKVEANTQFNPTSLATKE